MEKTWLIADTHFCHSNIIRYCNRPFANTTEMNEALIANWNRVVGGMDRVIVLGDFALCGKEKLIEIGQQLNGRKVLIAGNHDGASLDTYYEAGFKMISRWPIVIDEFFILSHEPQNIEARGRYANIFGHIHDSPIYRTVTSRSYCVSVERIDYTPILFDDIKRQMQFCEDTEDC